MDINNEREEEQREKNPAPSSAIELNDRLKWHFFNLYCMALSDSEFDPHELQTLYEIGLERGIDRETINKVVLMTGCTPSVPDTLKEKVEYLYDLARMAWADGVVKEEEKAMLKKYILRFGFQETNAESIMQYLLNKVKTNESIESIINELEQ